MDRTNIITPYTDTPDGYNNLTVDFGFELEVTNDKTDFQDIINMDTFEDALVVGLGKRRDYYMNDKDFKIRVVLYTSCYNGESFLTTTRNLAEITPQGEVRVLDRRAKEVCKKHLTT